MSGRVPPAPEPLICHIDLIVADSREAVRQMLPFADATVEEWLPNRRAGFAKASLLHGPSGCRAAVLTAASDFLTVNDVRGKIVFGAMRPWLACHAQAVIVIEPVMDGATDDETFSTHAEERDPRSRRLAAYAVRRLAVDPVSFAEELSDREIDAVEPVTLSSSPATKPPVC